MAYTTAVRGVTMIARSDFLGKRNSCPMVTPHALAPRSETARCKPCHPAFRSQTGAILLEVIFAIVLFASAAGVTIGGLTFSAKTVASARRASEASDLAVSILSQLQMGELELIAGGPFDADLPHDQWQWELFVEDIDSGNLTEVSPVMTRVEIVVTHMESGYTFHLVHLLALADEDDFATDEPVEGDMP